MKRPTPRRNAVAVAALTLATFPIGLTTAVLVAGSAAAALPTTITTTTTTSTTPTTPATTPGTSADSPAARYLVLNGTANAGSIHEIAGSSAFPNFKTGAIDNYYAMAHAHVDNAPFAQGTASPLDSGPIGQTAAAGHFQQPQYADARWPGDSGKATYGKPGEPNAAASASEYKATAEASVASRGVGGPSGSSPIVVPKELDDRLRQVLAAWTATWEERLAPAKAAAPLPTPTPALPTPTVPAGGAKAKPPVAVPAPPVAPVPAPTAPVSAAPAPPVQAPPVAPPTLPSGSSSAPSRSLASASAPPKDGASLLESSTSVALDPTTKALVTRGESSLGRVSLGGGQIVIEDINVSASITNDGTGTPAHKVSVSVGAASIGGVPVTIDEDGVHVSGQRRDLPYKQASDALNGALKQAGIKLFLVAPEITTGCDETGSGSDTTAGSGDQSGTSTMESSCDEPGAPPAGETAVCDQKETGTTTTTTTSTTPTTPTPTTPLPTTPTETTDDESDTTATPSACGGRTPTSSCEQTGTSTGTPTTSSGQTGRTDSGGMTISATGVHVVFAPAARQSGVPAQHAELILGEVFLDSLAVPTGPLPKLDLSSPSSPASSSACPGAGSPGSASGGTLAGGGGLAAGGSTSSGVLSPTAGTFGSTSQPVSGSTGMSLPAAFAAALTKPLWLLVAYLLWQAIVIGTGVSVWNWRRGDPA